MYGLKKTNKIKSWLWVIFFGIIFISGCSGGPNSSSQTPILNSIVISPISSTIHLNTTEQLIATGIYSNGTQQDVTNQVQWQSSNINFATISSSGLVAAISSGASAITASLNGVSGTVNITISNATLNSITITPTNSLLHIGFVKQLTATGVYSDGNQDITNFASWSSSSTSISNVSSTGLVTPISAGNVTIYASLSGSTIQGTATFSVSSQPLTSISVTPTNPTLHINTVKQFTATANFSDGPQNITTLVNWSVSNNNASISNVSGSQGIITTISNGNTVITASLSSLVSMSGSTTITISSVTLSAITVTPTNANLHVGVNKQYIAIGTYSDGSTENLTKSVVWSSSNNSVLKIISAKTRNGLATPLLTGNVQITATLKGVSGSTNALVLPSILTSIAITPSTQSSPIGVSQQFTATGTYSDSTTDDITNSVTWVALVPGTNNPSSVANISNTSGFQGQATGLSVGTASISASLGNITANTASTFNVASATINSITISPNTAAIANGLTVQFIATGTLTDNTTVDITNSVVWSSLNTSIATISNASDSAGLATAINIGVTTITASYQVSPSIQITQNASISVINAFTTVQISPTNIISKIGNTQQFTAQALYSNGSTQDVTNTVTWSSSNSNVATITSGPGNKAGLVTVIGSGYTVISATLSPFTPVTTMLGVNNYLYTSNYTNNTVSIYVNNGITGQLTSIGTIASGIDPYYLTISNQYLYAVNYTNSNSIPGTISSYSINSSNGLLTAAGSFSTHGYNPQSIAFSPNNNFAYITNTTVYGASINIGAFGVSNGQLSYLSSGNTGLTPQGIAITPSGQYAYVANNGSHTISMFSINLLSGALTSLAPSFIGGLSTPNHIAIHPSGNYMYVTDYSANIVAMYSISSNGQLSPLSIPSITCGSQPNAITMSPNGNFVYVSNSADNSISMYSINSSGILSPIGSGTISAPNNPQGIAINPSGQYAYVVNNLGVLMYSINASGILTLIGNFSTTSATDAVIY